MPSTISVAILGLGRVGASVAMALKRYNNRKDANHNFAVVGFDTRAGVRSEAEKLKLVDNVIRNPDDAVKNRDIVVIAVPYADARPVYQVIASALRPGVVVMDMSPLKGPALQWAKEFWSKDAHLVGVAPVLNPRYLYEGLDDLEHASADLFDNGGMLLMPAPNAAREAVELASDFASLLGATPHFLDPAEHDGLVAGTEGLPALLGVALFHTLSHNGGWADAQRLTNPAFGLMTHHLFDTHPDDLRDALLNNRENVGRMLDEMMLTLQNFRRTLYTGDRDALEAVLVDAAQAYNEWLNLRVSGKWDEESRPQQASMGEIAMSGMIGGFLAKRLKRATNDE